MTHTDTNATKDETGLAESVTFHVDDDQLATITFDLPEKKLNTFNEGVLTSLASALDRIETQVTNGEIRGVMIRSGKSGSFIAGADINLIAELDSVEAGSNAAAAGQQIFNRIQDLPVPTIALIDGVCLGGGMELALSCDYRVATPEKRTKMGLPETQLGVLPGWGGTFRLPRTVGVAEATKMILTGATVSGDKALRTGLVDLVHPAAFLEEWGRTALLTIVSNGSHPQIEKNREKAEKRRNGFLEKTALGRAILFNAATKDVRKRTGGHYPAQLAALSVLRKSARASRRSLDNKTFRTRALTQEHIAFGRLAVTPESKSLVQLFFARESVKRIPILEHAPTERVTRAAVLGAGVMGGKIAWLFSKHGIPVVMKDIAWGAVQKGYHSAKEVYDTLLKKRKIDAREANLGLNRIHGTVEYEALGTPQIVVEAVVERIDVKKNVLAELERYVSRDTIIASNTSALSIDEMAAGLTHPERFVGMHFFNPVNRMPLVEVVRGEKSSDEAVAQITRLALNLGKTPVVVRDSPGFIVNRLLLPYLNEAAVMLAEAPDYPRTDAIYTDFGMPMGPYTLLDEVGIDVGYHVAETLYRAFGERMRTAPILDAIKGRENLLGKKTGAGFYRYSGGKKGDANGEMKTIVKEVAGAGSPGSAASSGPMAGKPVGSSGLSREDILDRGMLNMVNEAARVLEEGIVRGPQELDLAMIMGTGFPPFRGGLLRWADTRGVKAIRDRLQELTEKYGDRFTPAPLLDEIASAEGMFYGRYKGE